MRKIKLYRDKIVLIKNNKHLVGLYIKYDHRNLNDEYQYNLLLGEFSPVRADKIIKLWNQKQ